MGREQKVGWVKSWRGSERSSSREKKYDQSVLYKKLKLKIKISIMFMQLNLI